MSLDPEKITFFAKTDARGRDVSFGIKAKDRQRHMYVVGKTGMGKSTLLENMAVQDIQNGEGMAFIDPHGSAAETLLDYIPEHRVNDVIYFAPFDLENPISFNVMEDVGPDKRHLVVSGLMSTFKKIWVDAWSARMEYILTNALLVLIEYPDTTLLSVNRIFNDKAYRLKVVDYCTDPAVKSFWIDEFANYTERFAAEALPAIQNKIGQFTGNPLIRNIIGQPHSSFDFRKCMDEKKIVIMNLSKGLVGETNANLLGSMLTTRIYLAAMSRADLPVAQMKQMPNFYFYVDEFQSFANATFANILSEARKYHLNLIIAHQYIEQMEEEVRDAVFGNVGTTISFRVGPFDAEVLETVFTPRFLAADLVNLGFAQIYLTLMIDGIGSQPFSAVTLPPIAVPSVSCKDMVIAASRRNFTKPRLEVEKIVTDLHTPEKIEKKTVSNNSKPNTSKPPQHQSPVRTAVPSQTSSLTVASPVKSDALVVAEPHVPSVEHVSVPSVVEKPPVPVATAKPAPAPAPKPFVKNNKDQPQRTERPRPPHKEGAHSSKQAHTSKQANIPKPAPSPRSEDLRAILAKIAQTAHSDKTAPAENKTNHPPRTEPATFKKINETISPLKAALAELKNTETNNPDRVLPPRPFPLPRFTPASVSDREVMEKLNREAEATFASLEQTHATPPPTAPNPPVPEPKQVVSAPALEQPKAPEPTNQSGIDAKQLAKILRSNAPEKSPFR
ncbi:MAG: type IV secretion system DNA-binding domain-containing protein [Patescibacteria group bacterium]